MNNKELNEQLKELIKNNNDLLAQTKLLKEQLQVKHVVIDTHAECQEKYAKLEAERYEYMIRYFAYFDNDKQHRKQIADQEVLYDQMSVQLVELNKHVIGLGYTLMFLTHSDEALEIEKFKRSKENKIEFTYDYGNLNASYVNEKINFEDDYFQEIINLNFEKIDSSFQQTSSLKPYVPNVILEKIIIDLEDEVVSSESENQSENDRLFVEKECDKEENPKIRTLLVVLEDLRIAVLFRRKNGHLILLMINDLLDDINFFIFNDESVKISPVSKMPFRKKPCDSMNARSKSNMIKSSPRTV
nr:hypothetical protein [Tanacetum cinerariifolium]